MPTLWASARFGHVKSSLTARVEFGAARLRMGLLFSNLIEALRGMPAVTKDSRLR
jgi:hypothetical protein